jgi:hypothetical protein
MACPVSVALSSSQPTMLTIDIARQVGKHWKMTATRSLRIQLAGSVKLQLPGRYAQGVYRLSISAHQRISGTDQATFRIH